MHPISRGARSARSLTAAVVLCGVLAVGAASPVWADEGAGAGAGTPVLGGFALGDAIEGMIDERDGALTVSLPAGGLMLSWDSRAAGAEGASGLPAGWGFGLARVLTEGGVRVSPASGGLYELDASQPSGLAGYGLSDLRFEDLNAGGAAGAVLAARADGAVGERAVRFRLVELGGTVTSFDEAGQPMARIGAHGERVDWVHDDAGRLVRVVDADGVVTELDWDAEPGVLLLRHAANLPIGPGDDVEREWRVELDADGVAAVEDPLGGRVEIGTRDGLVDRVTGVSGSVTEVAWQRFEDGVPRVRSLTVADASGVALSTRTWSRVGTSSASGWPGSAAVGAGPFGVQDLSLSYATELSDGATKVRSTYSGLHLLQSREVVAATVAGDASVQEQTFDYPELPGGAFDPAQLPRAWSRPAQIALTSYDATGGARSIATTSVFDEFGRPIEQTAADGTVTRTEYDQIVPDAAGPVGGTSGAGVPIGLPVQQTVTAPDGAMEQVVHRLNETRTAVIETETRSQVPGQALTTTGLTVFEVRDDGFVAEQRRYPGGDRDAAPVVTTRTEATDLAAGTVTVAETVGVGSPGQATVEQTVGLAHGGVTEQVDAAGTTTTTTFDALGRPVERTDAAGLVTRTTYETAQRSGRNATVVTTPEGVATTEVRDAVGRVTQTLDNIDRGVPVEGHVRVAEHRRYPAATPGTVEVTDAWGATTTVREDLFGREVQATSATGLTKLSIYDDVANTVTTALTPTGGLDGAELVSTTQLDDAGRAVGTSGVRSDGAPVPGSSTTFDGLGRELAATDGTLRSAIAYDAAGNPTRRTLTPEDGVAPVLTAVRRFDASGNSIEKTLRDDRHARSGGEFEIDPLGRTISTTDQADRVGTTDHSPDGLPIREVTASGRIIATEYDQHTRQPITTTTTSPTGATVRTATERDPVTGRVTAVYDPADREGTAITYEHDAFGNVTMQRYPDGSEIAHEYDAHGRKRSTTDVTGAVTRFAYDDAGLLTSATQSEDASDGADVLASVSYTYDAFARVSRLDRDTGVSTTYRYTSAGEIADETTTRADGATVSKREYAYDGSGNLVQRIDRVRDEATGELEASTTTYRYDAMQQLTASTVHDGDSPEAPVRRTTEYGLMVTGDIETETVVESPGTPGETRTERSFEYSPLGELLAITTNGDRRTQEHDATGNLVRAADGATYTYDAANRPVTTMTPDGVTTTVDYWPDGTRRTVERDNPKTGSRSAMQLYWDGSALVSERHMETADDGTAERGVASYLIGATQHARITRAAGADGAFTGDADARHLTSDRHGNVTELTDEDGRVAEQYAYTDYGSPIAPAGSPADPVGLDRNPYRYAGEFTDHDGSQFLTERLYLPQLMRFASDDPAPEHNSYAFGHLNPIMMVDPSGRTPSTDTIAGWMLTGLGAVASVVSIAGAALTGGASMSLLGVAGWMLEGGALAATAMTIADQVTPFLSDRQRLALNVTEIVLGALSTAVSRIGLADHGREARFVERTHGELMSLWRDGWTRPAMGETLGHARMYFTAMLSKFERDVVTLEDAPMLASDFQYFERGRTYIEALHNAFVHGLPRRFMALQSAFPNIVARERQLILTGRNVLTRSLRPDGDLARIDAVEKQWSAWSAAKLTDEVRFRFDFLDQMGQLWMVPVNATDRPSVVVAAFRTHLSRFMFLERGTV